MGTSMRRKRGFKGKPVQKNSSLGAYRQVTPHQGTVNGRSLFLLTQELAAAEEIIRFKTTKDFTPHRTGLQCGSHHHSGLQRIKI